MWAPLLGCQTVDVAPAWKPRGGAFSLFLCGPFCKDESWHTQVERTYSSEKVAPTICTALATELASDSAVVVAGLDNHSLVAWFWQAGVPSAHFCHGGAVSDGQQISCIGLAADNVESDTLGTHCFCLGSDTGLAIHWELDVRTNTLSPSRQWHAHSLAPCVGALHSGVSTVALDSGTAVTGGSDSAACIWRLPAPGDEEAVVERRIDGAHGGAVTAAACTASLGLVATAGEDGVVRMWSQTSDVTLPTHQRDRHHAGRPVGISGLVMDAKHRRLVTGSQDGLVRMWDIALTRPTRRFGHWTERASMPCGGPSYRSRGVSSVALDTVEAPTQMASGARDGSWQLWDTRQEDPVSQMPEAHSEAVTSLAVRGGRLLSASREGTACLWDLRSVPTPLDEVCLLRLPTDLKVASEEVVKVVQGRPSSMRFRTS
mmetsp:Transcript_51769/g.116537  ORF Transcript_51769/g.116537 Transcript_51769/m.116537 type:complete len:430 (+) Transcript_51769:105-1394(+)